MVAVVVRINQELHRFVTKGANLFDDVRAGHRRSTGIDYLTPALGGGFGPGHKVVAGYNFVDNNANPYPYDNAHGTGAAHGTVSVEAVGDRRLIITGEQVFDIRDFAIPSPTVLMLRIYPDVRVRLQAEAELEDS